MTYFNTNNTLQHELMLREQESEAQEKLVLRQYNDFKKATASMVWEQLIAKRKIHHLTPLTSIRRAISVLSKNGILRKVDEVRIGYYGRNEHYYEINAN